MSARRMVLLDDIEREILGRVLEDAAREGQRTLVDQWAAATPSAAGVVVHGLADAGQLVPVPESPKARRWMVDRLRALSATADRGRMDGWAPRWFVDQLADRIENENAPAGEPGSIRVGADDLRVLLDAAEGAAGRSPQTDADRAWLEAIADVVDRVGTLAAMTWTE